MAKPDIKKTPESPAPKPSATAAKKVYNKQELILGAGCVIAAVVVIFVLVYFMARENIRTNSEYSRLQEEMLAMNTERLALAVQTNQLEEQIGQSVSLEKLLQEADSAYGPEEKNRREGYLWIDREAGTLFVTLGALHGLVPGDKLTIVDGDQAIGEVRVETPMDVVSYVRFTIKKTEDFPKDSYKVRMP